MSILSAKAFGPLLRLWVSKRALLALLSASTWALGLAWVVVALRFNSVNERTSDDDFLTLLGATFIIGLPAALGILSGETVHELFRHTTTLLLPGLRLRLRSATLGMAGGITLLAAPAAVLLDPTLGWLSAVALSLAGFAAGTWLLIRIRGGALWVLRIASYLALLGFAPELAQGLGRSMVACLALTAVALAVIARRFHPDLVRASRATNIPTLFSAFGSKQLSRATEQITPHANSELYPPYRTGGDLAGWQAARDYEQLTMVSSSLAPGRMLAHTACMSALAVLITAVIILVRNDFPSGGLIAGTIALLADLLVGLPDVLPDAENNVFLVMLMVVGVTTAGQALLAASPLQGGMLYPLSRPMRARLAFAAGQRLAFSAAWTSLWLVGLVGAACWAAAGAPALDRMPLVLWLGAVHLIVVPWTMALFVVAARGHTFLSVIAGTVVPGVGVFLLISVVEWLPGPHTPLDWAMRVACFALVVAASFAGLRSLMNWHYASADLTTGA